MLRRLLRMLHGLLLDGIPTTKRRTHTSGGWRIQLSNQTTVEGAIRRPSRIRLISREEGIGSG